MKRNTQPPFTKNEIKKAEKNVVAYHKTLACSCGVLFKSAMVVRSTIHNQNIKTKL